jgi:2-keto-4-pentenoate hydratase/2-oxohepta-3-ene-1,7-dioic acid hydratase in catechol pathway
MKVCRFLPLETNQSAQKSESATLDLAPSKFGLIEGDEVCELTSPPWISFSRGTAIHQLASVRLVAPGTPSKIVCVGRNYAAHAAELGNEIPKEPMIFLKPPSSITGPGEPIFLPK